MKLTAKQKKAIAFLTEREVVGKPRRSKVPDMGAMKLKAIRTPEPETEVSKCNCVACRHKRR